jgi:hypothetical protein
VVSPREPMPPLVSALVAEASHFARSAAQAKTLDSR